MAVVNTISFYLIIRPLTNHKLNITLINIAEKENISFNILPMIWIQYNVYFLGSYHTILYTKTSLNLSDI